MIFNETKRASLFELQGCLYNFVTPNSKIKINIFQSAVGNKVPNGLEFLEFLRPIRELLKTDQIRDIRQLIQRELDDQRIINSLIPYLLNTTNREVAFFPSVLGVLMPKDYLNNLSGIYPTNLSSNEGLSNTEANTRTQNFMIAEDFYWSIKIYKSVNGQDLPYSSLTVDRNTCDIVIVDGQHRTNAFRAVNEKLTTDNSVIKEIYKNVQSLPSESDVSLPLTLLWFESVDSDSHAISPEIISRKLFIDVNNSARSIATSRKILLDDRNPLHLWTNHFYSVVARDYNFSLDSLSLAHLGCDVPSEVSQQITFDSMPFTYLTTPERMKNIYDVFFIRKKRYGITESGTQSPDARKRKYASSKTEKDSKDSSPDTSELEIFFSNSFTKGCIKPQIDHYMESEYIYVGEDLTDEEEPKPKQDVVRQEFEDLYFKCFYQLFSDFNFFKAHRVNIVAFDNSYINNPSTPLITKDSWKSSFLLGQSIYFTLRKSNGNIYNEALDTIENKFSSQYLGDIFKNFNDIETSKKDLLLSFRTLAFQIGFFEAFYQYCILVKEIDFATTDGEALSNACNDYLAEVNKIKDSEWVNCFEFVRDLQGEMHPKMFPVITHYILRRIQTPTCIFDHRNNWYFSPECEYFYRKSMDKFLTFFSENFSPAQCKEFKQKGQNEILESIFQGKTIDEHLNDIVSITLGRTNQIFKEFLGIQNPYLENPNYLDKLVNEIRDNFKKKI
jgi:hypothetical protein